MKHLFIFILLIIRNEICAESEGGAAELGQNKKANAVDLKIRQNRPLHLKEKLKNRSKQALNTGQLNGLRLIAANGHQNQRWGRVEVFMNGQWGTVCVSENINVSAVARVICRELNGYADNFRADYFKTGSMLNESLPILLDRLTCDGTEGHLFQCKIKPKMDTNACKHRDDLGVRCHGGYKHIRENDHSRSRRRSHSSNNIYPSTTNYFDYNYMYPSTTNFYNYNNNYPSTTDYYGPHTTNYEPFYSNYYHTRTPDPDQQEFYDYTDYINNYPSTTDYYGPRYKTNEPFYSNYYPTRTRNQYATISE